MHNNGVMTSGKPYLAIFDDSEDPIKIPGWFNNLVSLGDALEQWDENKGKLVVVLTSPIARFASIGISFGITLNRLKRFKTENTNLVSNLLGVDKGELISIRVGDKQIIGKFFGIVEEKFLHIGPSRYPLSKISEIHKIRSYSEVRPKENILPKRLINLVSHVTDTEEKNYSEATSHIVIVGDKSSIQKEYALNIGLFRPDSPESFDYETAADFVKVKGIRDALGWSCEILSKDEFLIAETEFEASHLIISNNRNCSELSEYSFNKTKVFLLDSRDSLESALFSIKAYSQYCRRIDPVEMGWTPDKAFRGIVMVETNV